MNLAAAMLAHLSRDDPRCAIALLATDGTVAEAWTRAQLCAEIAGWQARFATAGLQPGDRIALSPDRHPSAAVLHVAALASGLAIVPINSASAAREVAALLESAGVHLIVTSEAFAERVRGAMIECPPWWTVDGRQASNTEPGSNASPRLRDCGDNEVALVIHTSGTTGRPKSVPLTHGNLRANVDALAALWHRAESDRLLHLLPMHHYHGLVLALYGSLTIGNTVLIAPRFDARGALDAIREHDVTLLMGVPTMYARLLDAARPEDDLTLLRLAISGSAPLGSSLWTRFLDRFGIALVERYGLTETGIVSSTIPGVRRGGSVGRPLPETRIAIHADETYVEPASAPGGTAGTPRGEICIRGPSVMRGYGNDPDANARSFRDGWFHSGDLGYFDAEGYLWVDGRIKDLIIVGGSNVVPGEVERVLSSVENAAELCVAGLPNADLGEIVAAFVVTRAGADAADVEREMRDAAEKGLAPYKRPRRYVFLEELPRNAMGKVDRGRLAKA